MIFEASAYIKPLIAEFEANANTIKAKKMEAYLLNKFSFYGVMTTERRLILKHFYLSSKKLSWQQAQEVSMLLWKQRNRELHYCAIEFIAFYKKETDENFIKVIEQFIVENSWWDSVDGTYSHLLRNYFTKFPEQVQAYTDKWNKSNNIWLQRMSIIFQLKSKDNTDTLILSKHIVHCANSKEFFVQKAIGWALREYAKTNPSWVKMFVTQNKLPALSKREAIKNL